VKKTANRTRNQRRTPRPATSKGSAWSSSIENANKLKKCWIISRNASLSKFNKMITSFSQPFSLISNFKGISITQIMLA
jgi:hypothetical protein